MSQSSMNIAAGSGAAVRAAINAAIQSLASNNSGTTAPTTTYADMWWADTTAGRLRRRSPDNLSWVDFGALDISLGSQLQSQSGTAFNAGGTAPNYTLTPSPAITSYAANQRFNVTFPSAGTTGSNTINISGKGAIPLKQYASDGSLVSGVVAAGMNSDVQVIGAGSYALILDPLPVALAQTGLVSYFAMSTAPSGWLKANGAAISRTAYSALFAAIGTTFGAGDGSTTFNLPDLRGEFVRGFDDGRGIDSGRAFGSWQADDFKNHSHSFPVSTTTGGVGSSYTTSGTSGNYSTASTGGSETRPRNVALLACIKY